MAMELDYDYLAKLVERTQMGDSDAFAELYTATYQKQYRCVDYSTESNPEKYALTKDTQQQLINSIYSLPQQFAQPIIMRYYNSMAIDEIADAMDCSRSTIKRRLHKGQKLLEAKLGKEKGGISFV